jgi:2-polyprenyl-3-methyl-5-hydroxy-6-metoxy-1,4-benzoquinol methylase
MKSAETDKWIASNKAVWEKRTTSHVNSEFYDMKSFLEGKSSLNTFELELLGDVNKRSLLHLQCHFGQDTLSLARMGASCTGVDFTGSAVATGNELAQKLSLDAKFVCCNVYDTRSHISETFDVVFTSYGTIGWLPDLKPWAKVVSESLKPGGAFVMVEFHPYVWMLDDNFQEIKYSYFNKEVIESTVTGSYASKEPLHDPMKEFGWNHPFSEVFTALLNAGLLMEIIAEYDGSPYNCFPGMEPGPDGLYRFLKWKDKMPLVYGIRFRKPHHENKDQ